MDSFIKTIEKVYEEKKDLPNPPKYVKTIEELLKLYENN